MFIKSEIKEKNIKYSPFRYKFSNYKIRNWKLEIGNLPRFARGFTLLELLIVMAVIGAMGSIVLISFGPASQQRARDANRRSDIKQYQTALEVYANKSNGLYPLGGGNITARCGDLGLTGGSCRDDPSGTSYQYATNGTEYVIWATLEYKPGGTQMYYVACSNGLSGERNVAPVSLPCPL